MIYRGSSGPIRARASRGQAIGDDRASKGRLNDYRLYAPSLKARND